LAFQAKKNSGGFSKKVQLNKQALNATGFEPQVSEYKMGDA